MALLERLRGLRRVPLVLLLTLIVVGTCNVTGMIDAGDATLRAQYYGAAPRKTGQRVVLIAADDRSVAAWGPPPWDWERLVDLLGVLAETSPSVIATVGHEPMFAGPVEEAPKEVREAIESGQLIVGVDAGLGAVSRGAVEFLQLPPEGTPSVREVVARTALAPIDGDRVPVHYLSPPSSLPTVPAHRVAARDVPSSTFAGKIVLIGLTSRAQTVPVATPVGAMSTAEVSAHALLGIADGRVWTRPSLPTRWATLILIALVAAWVMNRSSARVGLLATGGLAGLIILGDFTLFASGLLLWGAAAPVVTVVTATAINWYAEHRRASITLTELTEQMAVEVQAVGADAEDERRAWQDLAEMGHAYLEREATGVVAELPAGKWHMVLKAFTGLSEADIFERRRDVRRPPFRATYLTHRASVAERRVVTDEAQQTVVVPLTHSGRMCGIWLVSLAKEVELGDSDLRELEAIGMDMGTAIARLQERREGTQAVASASPTYLGDQVQIINRGIQELNRGKEWGSKVLEHLPLGLLVASVWGEIQHVNAPMRRRLADEFPDGIPNNDLRAVLARSTGGTLQEAHDMMRSVVRDGVDMRFAAHGDVTHQLEGAASFMLTRIRMVDEATEGTDGPEAVLLIARSDLDVAANAPSGTA